MPAPRSNQDPMSFAIGMLICILSLILFAFTKPQPPKKPIFPEVLNQVRNAPIKTLVVLDNKEVWKKESNSNKTLVIDNKEIWYKRSQKGKPIVLVNVAHTIQNDGHTEEHIIEEEDGLNVSKITEQTIIIPPEDPRYTQTSAQFLQQE